jgi:branched-chain amino acid aminotransferase
VTRELLVDWCGAREVDEPLADVLAGASEAFLASTTRDVQAISRWDDRDLPAPGPVTRMCAETWAAREAETMEP